MNDAFLPGNGFDTYEEQDRVLMGLSGSVRSGVAVRILQQQGFAVAAGSNWQKPARQVIRPHAS